MTHLLLSGRPGAGKTHVGNCVAEQDGFRHIETDTPAGMQTLNELLNGVQTPQSLGENVVLEWGFAPGDLPAVRWLGMLQVSMHGGSMVMSLQPARDT
jgi:hypothetical protein